MKLQAVIVKKLAITGKLDTPLLPGPMLTSLQQLLGQALAPKFRPYQDPFQITYRRRCGPLHIVPPQLALGKTRWRFRFIRQKTGGSFVVELFYKVSGKFLQIMSIP